MNFLFFLGDNGAWSGRGTSQVQPPSSFVKTQHHWAEGHRHSARSERCQYQHDGVLCHIPMIGPYNTESCITFVDALLMKERFHPKRKGCWGLAWLYVIVWDIVAFHPSGLVNEWFAAQLRMMVQLLPTCSPLLNWIEEFFSAWRWNVYDHWPYEHMSLMEAWMMEKGRKEEFSSVHCKGKHSMWCWWGPVV